MPVECVKLLPKQMTFVNSDAKEVLYSGAFGAGKSRGLCYRTTRLASIPNNVVGLCRKTRVSLVRTTLRTLLLPDGSRPPVLPPGSYTHHKGESIIELNGGGAIQYFGFDNPEAVGSMNLGSCGIDEGIELDEDEYTMILGRCRLDVDPVRSVYTATNPGAPTHFLYKRFFGNHAKRHLIQTTALENFFLPKDYLEILQGFTGVRRQRYVEGQWVAFEGLIYDMFNHETHVFHRERGDFARFGVGFDEGYTNPVCLLLFGEDNDGRLHVCDEFYKRRTLQDKIVEHALSWGGDVDEYIGDPSAAGLIAAMCAAGLNAVSGDNDVWNGIRAVQQRLGVAQDGRPRYSVEPHCTNHILEFGSYVWADDKDKPVKEMDHSMDAARYYVYWLDKDSIRPSVINEPEADAEMDRLEEDVERYERIMQTEGAWN